jgi:hypothetical protein
MAFMPMTSSSPAARQGGAYNVATHFMMIPVFLANFIVAIVVAVHSNPAERPWLHWWLVVVSFCLLLAAAQMRMYSLRVQDRVIRMEERLRIAALVPGADVSQLSMQQLIALRFASDGELPKLALRAISEKLDAKAIKAEITSWRADEIRI